MEIDIPDNKLRKAATDSKAATKQLGKGMAKKLGLRIAELSAAVSLADFWPPKSGPARCHELQGKSAGNFTVDLVHPYRLVFEPAEDLPPKDGFDERARWTKITKIRILSIEDTHE